MSEPLRCLLTSSAPCGWTHHAYKHHPARGTTVRDTVYGPAKYLPGTSPEAIRDLESQTAREPAWRAGTALHGKTEYLRSIGRPIGWDEGRDADLSYAECSGGSTAGRTFHGRPMHGGNTTAVRLAGGKL